MATKKITLNELTEIVKTIMKEENESNLKRDAISIGYRVANKVTHIIQNEITDEINGKLWSDNNPDVFYGFYEKILDTIMNYIYENYGDSFNTKAGAAPDEY